MGLALPHEAPRPVLSSPFSSLLWLSHLPTPGGRPGKWQVPARSQRACPRPQLSPRELERHPTSLRAVWPSLFPQPRWLAQGGAAGLWVPSARHSQPGC